MLRSVAGCRSCCTGGLDLVHTVVAWLLEFSELWERFSKDMKGFSTVIIPNITEDGLTK